MIRHLPRHSSSLSYSEVVRVEHVRVSVQNSISAAVFHSRIFRSAVSSPASPRMFFPPPSGRLVKIFILLLLSLLLVLAWIQVFNDKGHRSADIAIGIPDKVNIATPKLSIVVPFRDRFEELLIFVPYISKFVRSQGISSFTINIINQSRRYRFNRGSLANIGFLQTKNQSDYIAIHDIDLLPLNKNLSYHYPRDGPYHMSSPVYHPQYNYNSYLGGILLISNHHFQLVNGFSNRYFGWGLEDDEFYTRIRGAKLHIDRPINLTTNKTNTFMHVNHQRKRDTFKTVEQLEVLRKRDHKTGLNDLKYLVSSRQNLTIDGYTCFVFNVELFCDLNLTPWCSSTNSQKLRTQIV